MSGDMLGYFPLDTFNDNDEGQEKGYEKREEATYRHRQKKKNQSREPTNDIFDDLLSRIEEKEKEIERLRKENQRISRVKEETQQRSEQLTSKMAEVMDLKGSFENVNDAYNNSKLSERFQKLYSNDWVKLSRWMAKNIPEISELRIINNLTEQMKYCYQECNIIADSQIRHFLLLDMDEPVPENDKHQELFSQRRRYSQTEAFIMKIKTVVSERLLLVQAHNDCFKGNHGEALKEKLKDFFGNYLECCWAMVVSHPAMRLNFDVIGEPYRDHMEQFSIYSPKTPVEDMNKEEDTIYAVVWPSVCLQDGSKYYQKGDVVIVKRGYKPEHRHCHFCTYENYGGMREEHTAGCMGVGGNTKRREKAEKSKTTTSARRSRGHRHSDV